MARSSSSSSSFNSSTTDRIPTMCYCNPPLRLKKRISWTETKPGRRFLSCPNSMYEWKRCKAFFWIDEGITYSWYKRNMYELYMYLNREQRDLYQDCIKGRDKLIRLNLEFEDYKLSVEEKLAASAIELGNAAASISFWKKAFAVACLIAVLAVFNKM